MEKLYKPYVIWLCFSTVGMSISALFLPAISMGFCQSCWCWARLYAALWLSQNAENSKLCGADWHVRGSGRPYRYFILEQAPIWLIPSLLLWLIHIQEIKNPNKQQLGWQRPSDWSDRMAQNTPYNFIPTQANSVKGDCALGKKHLKWAWLS